VEYNKLLNRFSEKYTKLAIEKLNIWKLDKLENREYKKVHGNDYLKILKWVMDSVRETYKKLDYNEFLKIEDSIKKQSNPELLKKCEEMIRGGYLKSWEQARRYEEKDILNCYNDYLERKAQGEYL